MFNPVALIVIYFVILILQNFSDSVEGHNQEGVKHHEEHPDVNHLDIGGYWQRLNHSDEAENRGYDQYVEYKVAGMTQYYYAYKLDRTRRSVRLTPITISRWFLWNTPTI